MSFTWLEKLEKTLLFFYSNKIFISLICIMGLVFVLLTGKPVLATQREQPSSQVIKSAQFDSTRYEIQQLKAKLQSQMEAMERRLYDVDKYLELEGRFEPYQHSNSVIELGNKILSHTSLVVTVFGIGLAIVTIFLGILGPLWAKRYLEINQKLQSLDDLTVVSARLILAGLPEYSEAQQIPKKSREALEKIYQIRGTIIRKLKKEPESLSDILLARGMYFFANYELPPAINEFEQIIDDKRINRFAKENAKYHLGMIHRQRRDFHASRQYFCEVLQRNEWGKDDARIPENFAIPESDLIRLHFYVGLAITYYIEGFKDLRKRNNENNFLDTVRLWSNATSLFLAILDVSPDNALTLNGIVKLAFKWRTKEIIENVKKLPRENKDKDYLDLKLGSKSSSELKNFCRKYINILSGRNDVQEDLPITANWYLCLGITAEVYKSLFTETEIQKPEHEKYIVSEVYFNNAKKHARLTPPEQRIYSEEQEQQISVLSFETECDYWKIT